MTEKDLDVFDVWESPNGNHFIKITNSLSIAIGPEGGYEPHSSDLKHTQYVKADNITPVKKIGKIVFD